MGCGSLTSVSMRSLQIEDKAIDRQPNRWLGMSPMLATRWNSVSNNKITVSLRTSLEAHSTINTSWRSQISVNAINRPHTHRTEILKAVEISSKKSWSEERNTTRWRRHRRNSNATTTLESIRIRPKRQTLKKNRWRRGASKRCKNRQSLSIQASRDTMRSIIQWRVKS